MCFWPHEAKVVSLSYRAEDVAGTQLSLRVSGV